MALVSEKTYMSWTKKGHFIRSGFDYIFQNPIWQTTIPKQWSLCPYFWMSLLVGHLLIRCFIVPIFLIAKLIAFPVKKLDRSAGKWVCKNMDESKLADDNEFFDFVRKLTKATGGSPIFLIFFFGVIIAGVGGLTALICSALSVPLVDGSSQDRAVTIVSIIFSVCLVGHLIYYNMHQHDQDRCKTEVYVYLSLTALVGVILYYFGADIWAWTSDWGGWILSATWEVICSVGNWLWWLICVVFEFCKNVILAIPSFIVAIFHYSKWALAGFALWIGLIYASAKMFIPKPPDENYLNEVVKGKELHRKIHMYIMRRNYDSSLRLYAARRIRDILENHKIIKKARKKNSNVNVPTYVINIIEDHYWEEILDDKVVPECLNCYTRRQWNAALDKKITVKSPYFPDVQKIDSEIDMMNWRMFRSDEDWYEAKVKPILKKVIKANEDLIRGSVEKVVFKQQKIEARTQICNTVTKGTLKPFIVTTNFLWACLKGFCKGIWATLKFIWQIIPYTWDVMKHKKKGACPLLDLDE